MCDHASAKPKATSEDLESSSDSDDYKAEEENEEEHEQESDESEEDGDDAPNKEDLEKKHKKYYESEGYKYNSEDEDDVNDSTYNKDNNSEKQEDEDEEEAQNRCVIHASIKRKVDDKGFQHFSYNEEDEDNDEEGGDDNNDDNDANYKVDSKFRTPKTKVATNQKKKGKWSSEKQISLSSLSTKKKSKAVSLLDDETSKTIEHLAKKKITALDFQKMSTGMDFKMKKLDSLSSICHHFPNMSNKQILQLFPEMKDTMHLNL